MFRRQDTNTRHWSWAQSRARPPSLRPTISLQLPQCALGEADVRVPKKMSLAVFGDLPSAITIDK
jgi:hypothetical protein